MYSPMSDLNLQIPLFEKRKKKEEEIEFEIFTDGGCEPNPGRGRFAYVVTQQNEVVRTFTSEIEEYTTNNRMEMKAILKAIEDHRGMSIRIHSDSSLCVNTLNSWMFKWKEKKKKKYKNPDLIDQAYELLRGNDEVEICWIKGHAGHRFNELADQLCSDLS